MSAIKRTTSLVLIEYQLRRALRKLSACDVLTVAGAEYVRRTRHPAGKDTALWTMVLCVLDDEIRARADRDNAVRKALAAPKHSESHKLILDIAQSWRASA